MSAREKEVRRKQWLKGGGLIGGVLLVAMGGGFFLTDSKPPAKPVAPPAVTVLSAQLTGNDKDNWRAQQSGDMERMRQQLSEMNTKWAQFSDDQVKREAAERDRLAAEAAARATAAARPPEAAPPPPTNGAFRTVGQTPPPPAGGSGTGQDDGFDLTPRSRLKTTDFADSGASAPGQGGNFMVAGAQQFGRDARSAQGGADPAANGGVPQAQPLSADTYVPAGSYVRAIMLNGVDAPTGGQSQQNPAPALLRLIDDGRLPNAFRGRLRDCVITVNGFGELSSERALLRTDRLSCVLVDGSAIDLAVKGYVAGEDGKTGLRGRVVSKTGEALGNAIWAAGLSAIGAGVAGSTTRQNQNAFGTTTTTTDNPAMSAFGKGTEKAFDRLAQYYINLADKLFPVIEIDGGRVVEVVFTGGFNMAVSPTPGR